MESGQTNKPDGERTDGTTTPVDERGAVQNQSETTADAYPDKARLQPDKPVDK
ncbi:hypothetical protein [Sphingomonas baiyangensis]|uniref:hypothetical protein n=1 Tax=Sphingomonas baiyangensis TaxID=2572576 RepID=UPI001469DC28|nr:hypothetical protein [Sphingomonas baiyangensis]